MNAKLGIALAVALVVVAGAVFLFKNPASEKAFVASGHPEWPPIMLRSGDAIVGAGPSLVQKIFNDLGVSITVPYTGTWDEVQAKAKSGEVDVLVAAYKTAERETYMVYSEPYTTDPVALFIAKGKVFPFDTWDDLKDKKGVVMVGDSYGQEFDDFASTSLKLTRVSTSAEAFDMLSKGTADYFIYSLYAGDDQLKKNGALDKFESLPNYVAQESFYITVSKQSPLVKYLPQINAAIEKYKADGTVKALIEQYKNQ